MENLTEEQLRYLALTIVKLSVCGGVLGALIVHFILGSFHAFAEYLASEALKAALIRAARSRATAQLAPVAEEAS